MLTWPIDYVKLQFRQVLQPENLARIEVGLVMQRYQRLMISLHNILLSMDIRLPAHTYCRRVLGCHLLLSYVGGVLGVM